MSRIEKGERGDRLLTLAQLREEKGISYHRNWLWTLAQRGEFPKPVKLGDGQFARRQWWESEVDAWLASRKRQGEAA